MEEEQKTDGLQFPIQDKDQINANRSLIDRQKDLEFVNDLLKDAQKMIYTNFIPEEVSLKMPENSQTRVNLVSS